MEFEEADIQSVRFLCSRGGLVRSTTQPEVTCHLPEGALTIGEKCFCRVSIQVINLDFDLVRKHLGDGALVSPIVTIEPIRRKFHKQLSKRIPLIGTGRLKVNDANDTLRVLYSITGSGENSEWQEITASVDQALASKSLEDGYITLDHLVTGRFVVIVCGADIANITEMISEILRISMNGGQVEASNTLANLDLLKAAHTGDLPALMACLKERLVNINYQNKGGQTALHIACRKGHASVVKELLSRGANTSLYTAKGNAAIHIACFYGHVDVLCELLEHGCDVNFPSQDGFPPMYPAVLEMKVDVVKTLLANGSFTTWTTPGGLSLLLVAVYSSYDKEKIRSMLQFLLNEVDFSQLPLSNQLAERGFRCHGDALLHSVTARQAANSMIGPVRQHLTKLSSKELQEDLASITTYHGEHAEFFKATAEGAVEKLPVMLAAKPGRIHAVTERRMTALHCACAKGHLSVVQKLLSQGSTVNQTSEGGFTCLHIACADGHLEIVKLLIRAGADPSIVNKFGLTSNDIATEMGHRAVTNFIRDFEAREIIQGSDKDCDQNIIVVEENITEEQEIKDIKKKCCTM